MKKTWKFPDGPSSLDFVIIIKFKIIDFDQIFSEIFSACHYELGEI